MPRNASAITSLPTGWEAEDYPQEDLKLISRTLDVVGDAWSLLIIREALAGTSRFGQFQRSLGLAPNILAARLRALVEHGVLETHASAQRADWSDYVLTEKGAGLHIVLAALRKWGGDHCTAPALGAAAVPEQ
ncbi:winged helix-turn-helix transcriptional regulator [Cupriavidus sp. 2KB_3]|uniref:winged helix-turn-helix transcriptional regulator n=1 Tax=Cupriavidus sp. 2KB_3 TaxID=3232980 RepID=UPI003F90CAD1